MSILQDQINRNIEDIKVLELHTAMIYKLIDRIEEELKK